MTKVLAVEHLRTMFLMVFGMFPLLGLAMWLMGVSIGGEDADPSFRIMIGGAIGVAILLAGAITVYLLLIMHRPQRYLDDMAGLARGEGWAHWTYDEQQWRAANTIESARQRRGYAGSYMLIGLGAVVAAIGLLWDDADATLFVWVGGICVVGGLAVIAAAWLSGTALLARRERTGELRISAMGVLRRPGRYSALAPTGPLTEVALVPGPPMRVVFTSTMRSAHGAAQQHHMADLLVPAGREDEARALVERFNAEVVAR